MPSVVRVSGCYGIQNLFLYNAKFYLSYVPFFGSTKGGVERRRPIPNRTIFKSLFLFHRHVGWSKDFPCQAS